MRGICAFMIISTLLGSTRYTSPAAATGGNYHVYLSGNICARVLSVSASLSISPLPLLPLFPSPSLPFIPPSLLLPLLPFSLSESPSLTSPRFLSLL
eukprot:1328353-Rhodomonas_salina.5